jgi:hypothetical protein
MRTKTTRALPKAAVLQGVTPATVRRLASLLAGPRFRPVKAARGSLLVLSGSTKAQRRKTVDLLGAEVKQDLLRVDLSQVESRYIGETEKNLRGLFDRAARDGALLIFDEADVLFGKRTGVKDAHGRYADMEPNVWLECLGRHHGPVVVTTGPVFHLPAELLRCTRVIALRPAARKRGTSARSPRRRR